MDSLMGPVIGSDGNFLTCSMLVSAFSMVRGIDYVWKSINLYFSEEKPIGPLITLCLKCGIEEFFHKWIL